MSLIWTLVLPLVLGVGAALLLRVGAAGRVAAACGLAAATGVGLQIGFC